MYDGATEFMVCIIIGDDCVSIQADTTDEPEHVTAKGARYIARDEVPEDAIISPDHPTYPERNARDVILYYADMLDVSVPPEEYHEVAGGTVSD